MIAVISDIHDNLANLEKFINWCRENKPEAIFCCGDVTDNETLEFLSRNFSGNIYLVRGNADIFDEADIKNFANIKYFGTEACFEYGGKTIGLCHKPEQFKDVLRKGPCDIIFYGHTHQPWESVFEETRAVNPGTLGGLFLRATFAVWDEQNGGLKLNLLDK